MKIRTGFVSNSSSSSFVAVLTKETFDKFTASLSPIAQVVAKWSDIDNKTLDGTSMVIYLSMSGNEDTCPLHEYHSTECVEFAQQALAVVTADYGSVELLQEAANLISENNADNTTRAWRAARSQKEQNMRDAVSNLREVYYNGRSELEKTFAALEKDGKCVIIRQDF
jgi:spore maturation protein CgeB